MVLDLKTFTLSGKGIRNYTHSTKTQVECINAVIVQPVISL